MNTQTLEHHSTVTRASRRTFLQAAVGTGLVAGSACSNEPSTRAGTHNATDAARDVPAQRIDVHHHIVPDFYVEALRGIGIHDVTGVPFPTWSPEAMYGSFERMGISKAILSVSAPGVYFGDAGFARELARRCNEYHAQLMREAPDRLGGFATVPLPSVGDAIAESTHALDELGLNGVCLLTNYDGVYLGDPKFDDYLAFLNDRHAVVLLHPTMPPAAQQPNMPVAPAILEFVFDTTRAITSLLVTGALERFSNIRFIVSHLGGTIPMVAWRLRLFDSSPREPYRKFREIAPHPVAHYLSQLYYDVAVSASPSNLRTVLDLAGPEHILFGSDFPFLPPGLIDDNAHSVFESDVFDAQALHAISYGNANRLFAPAETAARSGN